MTENITEILSENCLAASTSCNPDVQHVVGMVWWVWYGGYGMVGMVWWEGASCDGGGIATTPPSGTNQSM